MINRELDDQLCEIVADQIILRSMTMMMTIRECDIATHQIILRSMAMITAE